MIIITSLYCALNAADEIETDGFTYDSQCGIRYMFGDDRYMLGEDEAFYLEEQEIELDDDGNANIISTDLNSVEVRFVVLQRRAMGAGDLRDSDWRPKDPA